MSITDELRKWAARELASWKMARERFDALTAIADRIDDEHEREVRQAHADGLNEQVDFHDNFIPSHYILLPVDADGEPIHVGDEMECITSLHPDVPKAFKVQRISLESSGWTLVAYPASYKPENCRHVKQATVEDVLQEFADQYAFYKEVEKGIHPDLEAHKEVLRQYAAKLRLADE